MSIFSPRRYQAPFYPMRQSPWPQRLFSAFERAVKGPLFGCRMCGNCILQETAFVCPMTCPKGLRNGPCGGALPDRCEVDPTRPCTWYLIYERAERLGRLDTLLENNAPLDGARVGQETWLELFNVWRQRHQGPYLRDFFLDRAKFNEEWQRFFYALRQPAWWQGDACYHPPAYREPVSHLEAQLRQGIFVVTAEITAPLGQSPALVEEKAGQLKTVLTAANFTDNAAASPRMSSLAASKLALDAGLEPVMQLQARDRNRTAIAADAIGAASLGIRNMLCLSGDHQRFGALPLAVPNQFDLDASQMLWLLRRMRDEGHYLDGRVINERPQFFLGAVASPFGLSPSHEAIRLEKKVNAGAQFIQTQPIFDYERFTGWLEALDKRNLLDKVYILAGLMPLKSAPAAHRIAAQVPGIAIPRVILKRMDAAADKAAQQQEGIAIALELVEQLKATPGIRGIHIMTLHWEAILPQLVAAATRTHGCK